MDTGLVLQAQGPHLGAENPCKDKKLWYGVLGIPALGRKTGQPGERESYRLTRNPVSKEMDGIPKDSCKTDLWLLYECAYAPLNSWLPIPGLHSLSG